MIALSLYLALFMGWSNRHLPIQLGQHLPGSSLPVLVNHSGSWLAGTSAFDLPLFKFAKFYLSSPTASWGVREETAYSIFPGHGLGILHLLSFPTEGSPFRSDPRAWTWGLLHSRWMLCFQAASFIPRHLCPITVRLPPVALDGIPWCVSLVASYPLLYKAPPFFFSI